MSEKSETWKYRPFIYTAQNGTQILISVYVGDELDEDGQPELRVTMAVRPDRWATWGAPLRFEIAP